MAPGSERILAEGGGGAGGKEKSSRGSVGLADLRLEKLGLKDFRVKNREIKEF